MLIRVTTPALASALLLLPMIASAAEVRLVCEGETSTAVGDAWVKTQVLNGTPTATTAEFMPMFHSTIAAVEPARIPNTAKADGETPNSGAFPAAKIYYEYLTRADGKHDLPAYRLRLEVPVFAGGENKPAFFKIRIGGWEGGKLVTRTDISGIVGIPDVPIYGVDLEIRPFDGRKADGDGAALEAALAPADHADIEIREGSVEGPLRLNGAIGLATGRERLMAVAGALRSAGAKLQAGSCKPAR